MLDARRTRAGRAQTRATRAKIRGKVAKNGFCAFACQNDTQSTRAHAARVFCVYFACFLRVNCALARFIRVFSARCAYVFPDWNYSYSPHRALELRVFGLETFVFWKFRD